MPSTRMASLTRHLRTVARRLGIELRPRLIAVLPFRDEMRFLPGWFANVLPHVDGVVAVDDGSADGSAEFVAQQPKVLQLLRRPRRPAEDWDCGANRRDLYWEAGRLGAEWILGLDADERLERDFRKRAESEIRRMDAAQIRAGSIRVRELWNRPDRMRVDGIWGRKAHGRLFRFDASARLDDRKLHGHWPPLDMRRRRGDGSEYFEPLDLELYHLRMVAAADRERRRDRYNALDPERLFQAVGYEYLTDPTNLEVVPLPEGRDYEPMPEDP